MKIKKIFSVILASILIFSSLTACEKEHGYSQTAVPSDVTAFAAATEPAEVTAGAETDTPSETGYSPIATEPAETADDGPTALRTATQAASSTAAATPAITPTVKPTDTPTSKPTETASAEPTATPTPKPTATPTPKPAATPTPSPTPTSQPQSYITDSNCYVAKDYIRVNGIDLVTPGYGEDNCTVQLGSYAGSKLGLWGWYGTTMGKILEFGYSIDGGVITSSSDFVKTASADALALAKQVCGTDRVYTGYFDINPVIPDSNTHVYRVFAKVGSNYVLIWTVTGLGNEGSSSEGLDITDKTDLVSICYTVWFNAINGNGTSAIKNVSNVSEMLKEYNFTKENGFTSKTTGKTNNAETKFHYWAEPAQGYYRSTDATATENNMTMLYNAGVDFIIVDLTYATAPVWAPGTEPWTTYIGGPVKTLLDTITSMRAEGKGAPYVVFWMGSDNMFDYMYQNFYSKSKWADCFVYWNGKPFIMKWNLNGTVNYEKFTVRAMYGLQSKVQTNQWSYLEVNNALTVAYDSNGKAEHACVDVATQETYMSYPTAHGRNGGKFWYSQWQTAFRVHPKIITVAWWNEWCAQLYHFDGAGWVFTDNFNQEYSRDIEPMKGGHGDQYYKWLISYIEAYKAGEECPKNYV